MSTPTNSTVNLLTTSKSSSAPTKDFSLAFATLQSSYGFGASAPVLPSTQEKDKSTSFRTSHRRHPLSFLSSKRKNAQTIPSSYASSFPSSTEKQYNESFGQLQSVYGLGAGFAPITPTIRSNKKVV